MTTKKEVTELLREALEDHFQDFADEGQIEEAVSDIVEQFQSVFDIYPDEEENEEG